MKSLITLGKSRLALGTAVGFYGLAMQLLVQLLSVPILTHSWGLAGYGAWVLLFSVPSLLAMADLGLTTAGANAMTAAVAHGDQLPQLLQRECGVPAVLGARVKDCNLHLGR